MSPPGPAVPGFELAATLSSVERGQSGPNAGTSMPMIDGIVTVNGCNREQIHGLLFFVTLLSYSFFNKTYSEH